MNLELHDRPLPLADVDQLSAFMCANIVRVSQTREANDWRKL
jgi:hypothetical protein